MVNRCPTCSQSGGERSNPQAEARCGEPASRNASELDSASLHYMGVANLPERVKPATDDEATPSCNRGAPRGDWRQRVGKEKSRNLRGPRWVATPVRESDDPIVARKGLTSLERRGSAVSVQASKPSLPPGLVPITETKRAMVAMCAEHAYAWEAYRRAGCGYRVKRHLPIRTSGSTRGSDGKGIALR